LFLQIGTVGDIDFGFPGGEFGVVIDHGVHIGAEYLSSDRRNDWISAS
jgi:hypothetical protein